MLDLLNLNILGTMILDAYLPSSIRWRYTVVGRHNLRDLGYPDWMENGNASPDFVIIKIKDPQRICFVGEGKPKSHLGRPGDLRGAFAQVRRRLNKMAYPNPETLDTALIDGVVVAALTVGERFGIFCKIEFAEPMNISVEDQDYIVKWDEPDEDDLSLDIENLHDVWQLLVEVKSMTARIEAMGD